MRSIPRDHLRRTSRVTLSDTPVINPGARPEGVRDEQAAAASVQHMFDDIAPTYDRANHLLSLGLDRLWWNRAARAFSTILSRPEARILDLCCGTGDMTSALLHLRPAPQQARPSRSHRRPRLLPPHARPCPRRSTPHATPCSSKATPCTSNTPTTPSTSSPPPSAFAISQTTPAVSPRSTASSVPAASSASSSATSPPASSALLYSLYFKRILPCPRRPHLRSARRLPLPARLGRALPPPPADAPTHPRSRLRQTPPGPATPSVPPASTARPNPTIRVIPITSRYPVPSLQ